MLGPLGILAFGALQSGNVTDWLIAAGVLLVLLFLVSSVRRLD
ncbi:MAG TPA: hypothetical protein VN213_07615 [Solirubrobacteraceae bacterium]|nr:hypothetical protein [Solirubrobacteraceae bacterium]